MYVSQSMFFSGGGGVTGSSNNLLNLSNPFTLSNRLFELITVVFFFFSLQAQGLSVHLAKASTANNTNSINRLTYLGRYIPDILTHYHSNNGLERGGKKNEEKTFSLLIFRRGKAPSCSHPKENTVGIRASPPPHSSLGLDSSRRRRILSPKPLLHLSLPSVSVVY